MTAESTPQAWADLLEALTLLARHQSNDISPFHCEHDTLTVMADPEKFTAEELARLDKLGFHPGQFRERVMTTVTAVTQVPTEDLKALFDVAVGSLNFTSGFLDTDEVNMLRRIAVLIGADPMEGTPDGFAKQYPHPFTERVKTWPPSSWADCCRRCDQRADDKVHNVEEETR